MTVGSRTNGIFTHISLPNNKKSTIQCREIYQSHASYENKTPWRTWCFVMEFLFVVHVFGFLVGFQFSVWWIGRQKRSPESVLLSHKDLRSKQTHFTKVKWSPFHMLCPGSRCHHLKMLVPSCWWYTLTIKHGQTCKPTGLKNWWPRTSRAMCFHQERKVETVASRPLKKLQGTLRFGAPQGGRVRHASELGAHVQPGGVFRWRCKNHSVTSWARKKTNLS